MKRKTTLALLIGMVSFTAVVAVTGSIAWFTPTAMIEKKDNPLDGSTLGAYFAYGNGTPASEEHPNDNVYGITNPRHLYNLAWLQYLGFFNKDAEDGKQYYFELADNIDMTGWVLPPIGTENKPFIGNFNGNGYVVSGLTVSNQFSDYDKHPSDVTSSNFTVPHILGFFGVIGDYSGNAGSAYDTSANTFTNTGLTGLTIHTYTQDTLMGVAAGYVSGGLSNVAVDASTLNIDSSIQGNTTSFGGHTTNISDFTLVGYTTHTKQVTKIDETIYDVKVDSGHEFNANEQGDGETGWGGSINMKTIYERLYAFKVYSSTKNETLNSRINYQYYDGTEETSERVTRTNNTMYYYHGGNNTNHPYLGNYAYLNRGTNYDEFMYLSGGHYESYTYHTNTIHSGYRITDGTNYLTYNGTALGNTTTASQGTPWTFVEYSTNVYYIRYAYQSETANLYLYNNNGTLAIGTGTSTNNNARWTVTKNGNNLTITSVSDNTKKIYYYGGSWMLIQATGTSSYYIIQSGTNYISSNSTTGQGGVQNATSEANAAHFTVGNNNYVSLEGQTLYLTYYRSNGYGSQNQLRLYDRTTTGNYYTFTWNGTNLTANRNGTNYYVRYNNGWTVSTTNYNVGLTERNINYGTMYLSNTLDSPETSITGPDYYQTAQNVTDSTNNSHMRYTNTDTTYFPLNVNEDGGDFANAAAVNTAIDNGNFDPKNTNTGYITAGSDYSDVDVNVTTTNRDTYRDDISKVRISEYAISNINGSFSTSDTTLDAFSDADIYTINSSGTKRTMAQEYSEANYPRYKESKESFYTNALTTSYNSTTKTYTVASNVYGMHFLNTSISMNTIVNAKNVSILNNKADNYEMPVNAVDFNLKQKGVVNFFAGTYFTDNNSFFSLHEIFRNADASPKSEANQYYSYNTISEIKEIEEIYTTDVGTITSKYSNIYKYKDKTGNAMYSVPYRLDVEQNKYVMNKNNTLDNESPYTYDTMNQTDFNTYVATYGYQLRFKTSQIGVNSSITKNNTVYYYEFPMNEGEYCLGSVDGGVGAYLLYLDIGANASKFQRTIFYEKFKITESVFVRPDGVALVSLADPTTYEKETPIIVIDEELDYEDSACMRILPATKQTYTMDRNNNTVTLTRTNQTNAPPIYAGENITIVESGSSEPIEPTYQSSSDKLIKRMTYYDINVNMGTLIVTQVTDVSLNGGSSYERVKIVQKIYPAKDDTATPTATYVYDTATDTDQRDDMKVYNTSNGVKLDNDSLISQTTLVIDNGKLPTDDEDVLVVRIVQQSSGGYTEEIVIHAVIDENSQQGTTFYLYDRQNVTIELDDGVVKIKVVSIDGAEVYYGTTKASTVGQVITIEV